MGITWVASYPWFGRESPKKATIDFWELHGLQVQSDSKPCQLYPQQSIFGNYMGYKFIKESIIDKAKATIDFWELHGLQVLLVRGRVVWQEQQSIFGNYMGCKPLRNGSKWVL